MAYTALILILVALAAITSLPTEAEAAKTDKLSGEALDVLRRKAQANLGLPTAASNRIEK